MQRQTHDEGGWERLARLVKGRRNALGLTQKSVAGVSEPWLRRVEHAASASYRPDKLAALCRGLGWTPDSWKHVVAGEDPIKASRPAYPTSQLQRTEERLAALEVEVGALRDRVGSLTDEDGWIRVEPREKE